MDISNINSNTYTANSTAGNAQLENKRTETPKENRQQETPPSSQQAFQVNITQEAQDRLAAEATPPPVKAGSNDGANNTPPDNNNSDKNSNQNMGSVHEARQIVNIVA